MTQCLCVRLVTVFVVKSILRCFEIAYGLKVKSSYILTTTRGITLLTTLGGAKV